MMSGAKSGQVPINGTTMDYVSFGSGEKTLIMLPGLGDGLTTVKGMALVLSLLYHRYARNHSVYLFSRRNNLPEGCSTRDMARDQAQVMETLGLTNADVIGISQGGMIAQYLAIDHPDLVRRLVLAVTLAKQNETIQKAVSGWMRMARQGDYRGLMIDIAEKSYSEKYLKKYRHLYPFLGFLGKPNDFGRFLIQAGSCLHHDTSAELETIGCPTLVIGGGQDQIVGPKASIELADRIPNSELFLYQDLGHALYEEAKDFPERVLRFLEAPVSKSVL